MQKVLTYLNKNKIYLFLIGYFILEFLSTGYFYFIDYQSTRIVGYYKILVLLLLILSIRVSKEHKSILFTCVAITILYGINQLLLNPIFYKNVSIHILSGSIYCLLRFLTIFIFILAFSSWSNSQMKAIKMISVIEKILVFNTIFIIIGFLFQIKLFKSYHFNSLRFGYDGFFNKVNEVSYFYIIFIIVLYYRYITAKKQLILLLYIIGVSLLIGTKTVFLFLFFLGLYHLIIMAKHAKIYRIVVFVPLFFGFFFFKEILQFCFNLFPFWKTLSKQYSLQTMLFSTRDLAFYRFIDYFKEMWVNVNYFIGGSYYTESFHRSEMDIFDLFIFFGLIGLTLYVYALIINFFEKKNSLRNYLVGFVFLSGFLGGGLLLSMLSIIYLYLSSLSMRRNGIIVNYKN